MISDNIVFMGYADNGDDDTVGEEDDVGAEVFKHRNSRGEIDSLIIDSWYFFDSTEIDSM